MSNKMTNNLIILDWDYDNFAIRQHGSRIVLSPYDGSGIRDTDNLIDVMGVSIFDGIKSNERITFERTGKFTFRPTPEMLENLKKGCKKLREARKRVFGVIRE